VAHLEANDVEFLQFAFRWCSFSPPLYWLPLACLASYSLALRAILLPCEPFSCLARYSLALRAILLPALRAMSFAQPHPKPTCPPCVFCRLPDPRRYSPLAPARSLLISRALFLSISRSISLSLYLTLTLTLARACALALPPSLPPSMCLSLSLSLISLPLARTRSHTRTPLSLSLPLPPAVPHPFPPFTPHRCRFNCLLMRELSMPCTLR
jgi:hypothetical protein